MSLIREERVGDAKRRVNAKRSSKPQSVSMTSWDCCVGIGGDWGRCLIGRVIVVDVNVGKVVCKVLWRLKKTEL